MKIELALFNNTVARKVFALFIIAALLPVSLFAFFSTRQIDNITEQTIQTKLQKDSKAYAYLISDRLSNRKNAMSQIASEIAANKDIAQWQLINNYKLWFSSLGLISRNGVNNTFWGKLPDIDKLSTSETDFLQKGKTLMRVYTNTLSMTPTVIMIQQLNEAWLVSVLNNNELFGYEDDFDKRTSFCLFNHDNQALFCSKSSINQSLLKMISEVKLASRGKLSWTDNTSSIYAGYNSLFMQYHYFLKDWKIVFAQAKFESVFYQKGFTRLFYTIIAITLIFVVYISFLTIRQQMRPLDALMQGISRISQNNFSQPVPLHGKDEFTQLAQAFNSMSLKLSTQFKVLKALAEIDQLILSRLKMHDIIKVVIFRANDIIQSDKVCISLLNQQKGSSKVTMYSADPKVNNVISEQQYEIDSELFFALQEKSVIQLDTNETSLHEFVRPLINDGYQYFFIIPIRKSGAHTAYISFAYIQQPNISSTEKKWGQEFADRIAVAFANASWEKQLYHQAHYDSLTGLPNRIMFNEHLQYCIDNAHRDGSNPILLFLDLDGFKFINDSLGHIFGDKLLKQVAVRITSCLRKTDTVARLGGDEFVVILSGYHELQSFSLVTTVKKILAEIARPIIIQDKTLRMTGSIGIAIYPQDGETIEALLKNADAAMYEAKKQGRAQYQFYSEKLNSSMLKRLLLDADLHNALENNELELYFQPKIDPKTNRIIGAEALMRWIYPEHGIISPSVFIPLIEQSGLIIPIGNWLMQEACRQNKQWQSKGLAKIPVSINLSVIQFNHESLLTDVNNALQTNELEAQYLEIEITESMAMENFQKSVNTVNKLRNLGIKFSIDDYGTGYSSLEYIRDIPVDIIKIDRAFIINLINSYKEQAIVKSTIIMAHDLGLKVIAEGVENYDQCLMLQQMGCDEVQGFYYSKPLPAKAFEKLLEEQYINNPVSL